MRHIDNIIIEYMFIEFITGPLHQSWRCLRAWFRLGDRWCTDRSHRQWLETLGSGWDRMGCVMSWGCFHGTKCSDKHKHKILWWCNYIWSLYNRLYIHMYHICIYILYIHSLVGIYWLYAYQTIIMYDVTGGWHVIGRIRLYCKCFDRTVPHAFHSRWLELQTCLDPDLLQQTNCIKLLHNPSINSRLSCSNWRHTYGLQVIVILHVFYYRYKLWSYECFTHIFPNSSSC